MNSKHLHTATTLVLAPGFKCFTELHIRIEGLTLDFVLALAKLSQRYYCTSFVSVQQLYAHVHHTYKNSTASDSVL